MPAIAPREFVRELDNVLTLLQPRCIHLISSPVAPEEGIAWPLERNMLVWKDEQNRWHFKMLLLGEQHQGEFDANLDDDRRVIDDLNALAIHPNVNVSEEISEQLAPDVCARIARPYLHLSLNQQNQIKIPLNLSETWPLDSDESVDVKIQTCLALLRGEANNHDFSPYLTLETINRLAGGRLTEFCADNPHVTSGDILRFIQLLLMASVRALGHDESVVLPAPPVGHDRNFGDVPGSVENNPAPNMQSEISFFEMTLMALETSDQNLSDEDRVRLTESLNALRTANEVWVNSNKNMNPLLTFRRATDEVLQADHIQRLFARRRYPRLGILSDHVESPELQQLRLSLRLLRDCSIVRVDASKQMKNDTDALSVQFFFISLTVILFSVLTLNLMFLLALPALAMMLDSMHLGMNLSIFLIKTFREALDFEFSFNLWSVKIEAFREFLIAIPLVVCEAFIISAGYGLLAGELSVTAMMLTMAGSIFAGAFSLMMACYLGVLIVAAAVFTTNIVANVGYQAAQHVIDMISEYVTDFNQWFNETVLAENHSLEVVFEPTSDLEETDLRLG